MIVRRYESKDFKQIAKWAFEGFGTKYTQDQFPKTGFIVEGIGAYFLYKTDSSVCFLENLISNKFADPKKRDQGLQMLIAAILGEAKKLGFKVAYATTNNASVILRATAHGAEVTPKQVLLTKSLSDPSKDGLKE